MGLHKENHLSSFSPFSAEMRTRLWTYFMVLDQPGYNAEGSESLFDAVPWNTRSLNVNDHDWPSHRFVKADQVPPDAQGFTDMTFALVRRELYFLSRELRNMPRSIELYRRIAMIDEFEHKIREKYTNHMDDCQPMQCVIRRYTECFLDDVRIQSEFSWQNGAPAPDIETSTRYVVTWAEVMCQLSQGKVIDLSI